ncbi:sensor histidine kinase [Streptococcus didelphis]|uniref:sensor histidine kinase n=1 Tax=Streptococcus didelphis TaxID=102886 RepID=UPI0027D2C470|nr:sensor histidine kinase [Streptococcus didelphis]
MEDRKDGALVTIKDKGYGISEQAQRRIFEQFYQSDHSHLQEGNGLGLAIVKKIVDLLGGQIKVDSQLNQGTSFAIYLPNLKT